jgi:hypothetical protein
MIASRFSLGWMLLAAAWMATVTSTTTTRVTPRRRYLDENGNVNNNGVLYTGSIQATACLSYTILLENEAQQNEEQEQNEAAADNAAAATTDVDVMVVGQESFVYFDYRLDDTTGDEENSDSGDVVTAKTWFAAITGMSTACQAVADPATMFSSQIIQNVIVPMGWWQQQQQEEESSSSSSSLYYGPVCQVDGSLGMAVFVDPFCNSLVPGLTYLWNHKLDLSPSFGSSNNSNDDDNSLKSFVQNLHAHNTNRETTIDCQYNEFNACSTILQASVDLDTCTVVSEEVDQQQQQAEDEDEDEEEDEENGLNYGDANYGGAYDDDGFYHMAVADVQDLTDMCYGLLITKSKGQTLDQWQEMHQETLDDELRHVYQVSIYEIYWKDHHTKILAGVGVVLFVVALLVLFVMTIRVKQRRMAARRGQVGISADKKQSLLAKGDQEEDKATPKITKEPKKRRFTRAKKAKEDKAADVKSTTDSDNDSVEV